MTAVVAFIGAFLAVLREIFIAVKGLRIGMNWNSEGRVRSQVLERRRGGEDPHNVKAIEGKCITCD